MKTDLTIKNFRIFDEEGVTLEFNPITILTGTNSSGKSSVVKAVMLLNSFLIQIKKALDNNEPVELDKYKLDFSQYPNNLLGHFGKVVHSGSSSNTVSFEYTTYSLMISKDVAVRLDFSIDENDQLKNGYLERISISIDGKLFYSSSNTTGLIYNLNVIKADFLDYSIIKRHIHNKGIESKLKDTNDVKLMAESICKQMKGCLINMSYKIVLDKLIHIGGVLNEKIDLSHNIFGGLFGVTQSSANIESLKASGSFFEDIVRFYKSFDVSQLTAIAKKVAKKSDSTTAVLSQKVIEDFRNSKHSYFFDYFIEYEDKYLDNICYTENSSKLCLPPPMEDVARIRSFLWKGFAPITMAKANNHLTNSQEFKDMQLNFGIIQNIVAIWNENSHNATGYDTQAFFDLYSFAHKLVIDILIPSWVNEVSFVSSARAKVARLYVLNDIDDFTGLLKSYYEKRRQYLNNAKESSAVKTGVSPQRTRVGEIVGNPYEPDSFINRWIRLLGLGYSIRLSFDDDGFGAKLLIIKNNDGAERILADEGYGVTQLLSVLLQIETAILSAKYFASRVRGERATLIPQTIAIEEPEIHLHPALQSKLADMFFEAYEKYNIHFIIETHSEYLIRRTQVLVAKANYKDKAELDEKSPFRVYYVPRGETPYEMKFKTSGHFENSFGEGFFDEAGQRAIELYAFDKTENGMDINWSSL